MKTWLKRTIKITAITICSLILLAAIAIAVAVNFIFTPSKLTPAVLRAANETIDAHLDMRSVELTFFSTFPRFGVKLEDGALVSRALNDSVFTRLDSLVSFRECIVEVDPVAYLKENKIRIYNITLEDASVYAYMDTAGRANWDIVKMDADTVQTDTAADTTSLASEIDIRNIELKNANVTFDDRDTRVYARIDSANMKLGMNLTKGVSSMRLYLDNKNILFWQQGELLVNKVATSLRTDISVNRDTRTWTLSDTELTVNGITLDADGTVVRDTVAKTLDLDINYKLKAPSVETVLSMIPESIVRDNKVSAKGSVQVEGNVKGLYGDKKMPAVTLCIKIENASAHYKGQPYGIDHLSADLDAFVDLTREKPSYMDLKIFRLEGMHTKVLATAKVEHLLSDPLISFTTQSTVDLDALAKTFPLQKGVTITGKLDADVKLKCRLSSIKNQDIGRIKLFGKLELGKFRLTDANKDFDFSCDASFRFMDNVKLAARADIRSIVLKSRMSDVSLDKMTARISSSNPKDTTRITEVEGELGMNRFKAKMGDSIFVFNGRSTAEFSLRPGLKNPSKPRIHLYLRTDSLFTRYGDVKLGMRVAGIKLDAEKVRDSVWTPKGGLGFDRLRFSTPTFALPIRMNKTAVTFGDNTINLRGASVRVGRSNIVATGSVQNLYKGITKDEPITARLDIKSRRIDCNQLINALSFPTDTLQLQSDTTASENLSLFVIPRNINFEMDTNIDTVLFDKMVFENVHGNVDIKNQALHLEDLSMTSLGARVKTVMVYKAMSKRSGYAGFDFRIHDVNIARLVEAMPSMDSIVPMLRSFKGRVDFNVAAEGVLDSMLNIKIPTLHAAMHIKGDSLVLMDGETFAEISKMLMFKNKKENVFDSIAVNITVRDGNVTIYPFIVEIDRYKAAVGGRQGLDMSFDYHISILKSPLPFKAGVNIKGTLDKMKFSIGKAKYKNAVTPVEIRKVDSTRVNMSEQITGHFRRLMVPRRGRRGQRNAQSGTAAAQAETTASQAGANTTQSGTSIQPAAAAQAGSDPARPASVPTQPGSNPATSSAAPQSPAKVSDTGSSTVPAK